MAMGQDNAVTVEANYVYDNGRWPVEFRNATSGALTAAMYSVVPATAGMKIKVLSAIVICNAFTTAGNIELHDGVTAFPIGAIGAVGGVIGGSVHIPNSSLIIYQTGIAFALNIFVRGAATVTTSVTYYKAP